MRTLCLALALALSPLCHAATTLDEIINKPSVQLAMIVNLRNPQMRQKLNAELAKHPGSADKVNRFAGSITHIAAVLIEEDGAQMGFLIAIGNFDKRTRQMLQQEGLPAELMDDKGVCLGVSVNGQELSAQQIRDLAAAIKADKGR